MKRDAHEHRCTADGFFLDYDVDSGAEIDRLHFGHHLPACSHSDLDHDTVALATAFVLLLCFVATVIITSVQGALAT